MCSQSSHSKLFNPISNLPVLPLEDPLSGTHDQGWRPTRYQNPFWAGIHEFCREWQRLTLLGSLHRHAWYSTVSNRQIRHESLGNYVDPESFDVHAKWHNTYGDIPQVSRSTYTVLAVASFCCIYYATRARWHQLLQNFIGERLLTRDQLNWNCHSNFRSICLIVW